MSQCPNGTHACAAWIELPGLGFGQLALTSLPLSLLDLRCKLSSMMLLLFFWRP